MFKICLLVHKGLHGIAPLSIKELLVYNTSSRTLHLVEHSYSGSAGKRRFARIAPKLWNLLPFRIRMESMTEEFKTLLKTYLFTESNSLIQRLHER